MGSMIYKLESRSLSGHHRFLANSSSIAIFSHNKTDTLQKKQRADLFSFVLYCFFFVVVSVCGWSGERLVPCGWAISWTWIRRGAAERSRRRLTNVWPFCNALQPSGRPGSRPQAWSQQQLSWRRSGDCSARPLRYCWYQERLPRDPEKMAGNWT